MGTKIATPQVSLNAKDFSSMRCSFKVLRNIKGVSDELQVAPLGLTLGPRRVRCVSHRDNDTAFVTTVV